MRGVSVLSVHTPLRSLFFFVWFQFPVFGFLVLAFGVQFPVSGFQFPVLGLGCVGLGWVGVGLGCLSMGWSLSSCFGSSFVVGWALAPLGGELCPVTGTLEGGGRWVGVGIFSLCLRVGFFFLWLICRVGGGIVASPG